MLGITLNGFVLRGKEVPMRGVDVATLSAAAREFIAVRRSLELWFSRIPDGCHGAPHEIIDPLRRELVSVIWDRDGIFDFLRSTESVAGKEFTLGQRETQFAFGGTDSVRILTRALVLAPVTEISRRMFKSELGLSLLTKSIYAGTRITRDVLERYLWSAYDAVDLALRKLIALRISSYLPNHSNGKRPSEEVLRALAVLIVNEREELPLIAMGVRGDEGAERIISDLRAQPILSIFGRADGKRNLLVSDAMDYLDSPFPQHRNSLCKDVRYHIRQVVFANRAARFEMASTGRRKKLSTATSALEFQMNEFLRALAAR